MSQFSVGDTFRVKRTEVAMCYDCTGTILSIEGSSWTYQLNPCNAHAYTGLIRFNAGIHQLDMVELVEDGFTTWVREVRDGQAQRG